MGTLNKYLNAAAVEEALDKGVAAYSQAEENKTDILMVSKELSEFANSTFIKKTSVNLFDRKSESNRSGYMIQGSGSYNSVSGGTVSHPIPVENGKTYTFAISKSFYGQNALVVRVCDENGNLKTGSYTATANSDSKSAYFTPLADAFICVNVKSGELSTFMFVEGTEYPDEYKPFVVPHYELLESTLPESIKPNSNKMVGNPLYGKKLSLNGDSICYGTGYSGGYGGIIAENNGMTVSNIAVAGGTIAGGTTYSGGGNRHWICRTIENMPTDADYYIVEGGTNDVALAVPIGTLSAGYTETLDDSTFYGAMESICKQMITRFSEKKYGFLIVHQMKGGMQISNARYTAIVECCEKWGVPYLDLAKNCVPFGLFEKDWSNDLSALRNEYTADDDTGYGDGWHPTEQCYKKYYVPKIEAWLRTL